MSTFFAQDYEVTISSPGQTVRKTYELDKSVAAITRVAITSNREDLAYFRGLIRLEINKDEVFPEGYRANKLMYSINVPSDVKMKSIGRKTTGNGLVNFEYTDRNDGVTTFQPYIVSLSIEGERTEG